MVVRYDGRGTGLSDRDITDFTLDTFVLDLDAVVTHLGLERFDLLGSLGGGLVAIAYAARHPERVAHLLFWCSYAPTSEGMQDTPVYEAVRALIDQDWEIYTETATRIYLGWSSGEEARQGAAYYRECVTQETARTFFRVVTELDATEFVPRLRAPTLVLCRGEGANALKSSRVLASDIPDARLVVLEGQSMITYIGDSEAVLKAIDEFLSEGEQAGESAPSASSGLVTILFTDMQSSTANRQQLGDVKAQEVLRTHNRIVREALAANGGSEIKHTGDGIMASFGSAIGALNCAIAIQRGVEQHHAEAVKRHAEPVEAPLQVYIGLNAGEPISEDDDLFGTSVDLAARICGQAEPSEILVSDVVRQLAAGKEFLFSDRGDSALRGFEDPVRLWSVRWREDG